MGDSYPPEGVAADTVQTVTAAPSVLHNREFLFLWIAQVLSQIAQNALLLGLLVLVQRKTQSPTQLSLVTFAFILPSVLFGILAGVVVDRLNKKAVMVSTNALRMATSLLYLVFDRTLFLIYINSFLFATVAQFFAPAEASAIPMLVKRENLITANGLFNLTLSASQLLGLVILAPLLIKLVGISGFFIVLAVLFALATVSVSFIPADPQPLRGFSSRDTRQMISHTWSDIVEGWHILTGDRLASLAMLYLTIMASFITLLAVLGPIFAVAVIRANAEDVVYLFAPAGLAMVVTTVFLNRIAARVGKLRLMAGALIALGVNLVLLGLAKTGGSYILYNLIGRVLDTRHVVIELIPVVMLLSVFIGAAFVCINIPAQTLLQERCPEPFRGRIFGVQFTLSGAMSLIPLLGGGTLADVFGVNKTIVLLGCIFGVIGVLTARAMQAVQAGDN
jgi:MFS family permease